MSGGRNWRSFTLWHNLRSIGNSTLARMTIVIPVVGYLILFNEKLQDYLQISTELLGHPQAGSGLPRLLAIYFGLCFVAVASTLFALFCPLQVKKYASAEEYIASDEPHLSLHGKGQIEHRIKNGDAETQKLYADLQGIDTNRPKPDNLEEARRRGAEYFRVSMQIYFDMLDRSGSFVRWAVAAFYGIGFIALSVPAGLVFWRVSVVLFQFVQNSLNS
jgi:hypothetical protein